MKVVNLIKKNAVFLLGLLVPTWVILANVFPHGYIFAGGDTPQFINASDNMTRLFYDWQGRTVIFYAFFAFLDRIGINDTAQLSFYLGLFIFGSYVSFYIFTALMFPGGSKKTGVLVSLFYALNVFTLYIFTANWGYSHFPFLYIFVPVLTGLFIKFLKTGFVHWGILFVFTTIIASPGFGNPAFALSFSIFLSFLLIFLLLTKSINLNRSIGKRVVFLAIFSFLVNLFWIWPIVPQMSAGVSGLFSGNVIDLNWWLSHTSNPVINAISLHHYSDDYFPDNFPYAGLPFLKSIIILLSFLPAIIIFGGMLYLDKFKEHSRENYLAFLGLLTVVIMLTARLCYPFEKINYIIFNTWGLNTLRGYDKMAIYLPFLIAVPLYGLFEEFRNKKRMFFLMILILLTPLPFLTGKIQQNLSYRFSHNKPENKDYRQSNLSFLVKIPSQYYSIRDIINSDKEKSFIATLPHTGNDGSGTSRYPMWKFYGIDVTRRLYDKEFIEANVQHFNDWDFADEFNNDQGDPEWLVKLLGLMNAKYIIFHKDASEDSVGKTQQKMIYLENGGLIQKIEDNDYFTLYQIKREYIIPYLSWQAEGARALLDSNSTTRFVESARSEISGADFQEINPKKYLVRKKEGDLNGNLVIAEPYDRNWKAYAVKKDGEETEIDDHFLARDYANGWTVKNDPDVDFIVVEYYPARVFLRGFVISLVSVLFLSGYLIKYLYAQKNAQKLADN